MTLKEQITFYHNRSVSFFSIVKEYDQQLFINSIIRIAIFGGTGAMMYLFRSETSILLCSLVIGIIAFLFFVKRHLRLKYQKDFNEAMYLINSHEEKYSQKDFLSFDDGRDLKIENHEYAQDIDLFGQGSFFQYINRTKLQTSRSMLGDLLQENQLEDIESRQEVIQELQEKTEWRQGYSAEATLVNLEMHSEDIEDWIQNYKPFIPSYAKYLVWGFSVLSIIGIILLIGQVISEGMLFLWLFVGIGISAIFVKRITALSNLSGSSLTTFNQYAKLLERIENETWESKNIIQKLEETKTKTNTGSGVIQIFAKALNALDQRSNIMISIFANGFFLRDIRCAKKIEDWIVEHKDKVDDWFHIIHFFDQQISLGTFAFNHPKFVFPAINSEQKTIIEAKELGHPLLKEVKRVDNDFRIDHQSFFIITGANMAGKSTFLRTLSLAIVMSNVGLPICSTKANYRPTKLVTSMRTNDSLSDEESYFFSELKRLRYIIDRIEIEDYFIILDEILKGTNSVDKAEGSKKFIQRLVRTHSTGIIATHDLSLCETADEMEEIENYYFDAQIIDDELLFDYTLKEGICQNMNASFLLKKMDIV